MKNINLLYKIRFNKTEMRGKSLVWKVLCEKFFSKFVKKQHVVIDLACGFGEFLNYICAKKKIGVDINPNVKKFLQSDIIFLNSNAKSLKIKNSYVDICFSSNFFEHLKSKDELDLVLREALRIMKPGALYICMQPNIRFNYKNYWDFYDHNIPLSDLSCSEAFEKAGFIIEKIIRRFVKSNPLTFAKCF